MYFFFYFYAPIGRDLLAKASLVLVEPPPGLVKPVGNQYTVIILCKIVLDPVSDKLEGPREQWMHLCLPDTKLLGRQ